MGRNPNLTLLSTVTSNDQESYIRSKKRKGAKLSIDIDLIQIDEKSNDFEIINRIKELNNSELVDGIILETPIRKDLDVIKLVSSLDASKDVDSQNPFNQGMILLKRAKIFPATASAIFQIINSLNLPEGSEIVVINRSTVIGKPLSIMLLNSNYTVTMCH
ncbi:methylenetetrahydrofolate dehydrogenase/methenyltetrahydrofolate cyclohydrolase, partial [mine drainage metagenome]